MNVKRVLWDVATLAAVAGYTVYGLKKRKRVGPCSQELWDDWTEVRANKDRIQEYRDAHGDTTSGDFEIWYKHLRDR